MNDSVENSASTAFAAAIAAQRAGNLIQAERLLNQVLELDADNAEAHFNLGVLRAERGDLDSANASLRQALRLKPGSRTLQHRLGVRRHPRFVDAYIDVAQLLREQGELNAAAAWLQEGLRRIPDDGRLLTRLAQVLRDQGEFEGAVACIRKIIQMNPESARAHYNLGLTLADQGELTEAIECYRRTLELDPAFEAALVAEAEVLEKQGEVERALQIVKPLVAKEDVGINIAVLYTKLSLQIGDPEVAIGHLENTMNRPGISKRWRIIAHTQLGLAYDRREEYDRAFSHFQKANELKPGRFDAQRHERLIDDIILTCSSKRWADVPRATNDDTLPVFILGMPRSGTSLVEQILASHPRVHGAGELPDLEQMTESLPKILGTSVPYPKCLASLTQAVVEDLRDQYLQRLRKTCTAAERITDKMPHNYLHIGFIRMLFPSATIIHCVRDARDTCVSCYFSNFLDAHTFANDLGSLAAYHVQYERLMRHWRQTLGLQMLDIHYEQLVQDPEPMAQPDHPAHGSGMG